MKEVVIEYIQESTSSKESSLLKRDSKKSITSWKNRQSKDEIETIKQGAKKDW